MKKLSKKNLKKQLDKIWAQIIAHKKYCEFCKKPGNNAHHIIGRINHILRWDLRNGCYLCIYCHIFSKFSAHNDPIGFIEWFKLKRPDDYEYLLEKKNQIRTFSISDYEEILKELKEKLNEIQNTY